MFSGGIEIFHQGNVLLKFYSSVHNILLEMSGVIFSFIFRNYRSTTGYPWIKRKCLRNLYACETLSILRHVISNASQIKQSQRPLKVNGELYRQVDKTLEPSDVYNAKVKQ